MEANLYVPQSGAEGSYNLLIGDTDGRHGSGTQGRVVIDSGDAAKGFKSYDWWGTIRATSQGWSPEHKAPTFSSIVWDRWIVRNFYVTGGDAGLFWDCTNRVEPFTIVVEDCVSIGRAFGGGVANSLSRHDEPITFRRCKLWSLDEWGDTAGLYIRIENAAMPGCPDVVVEDCTMVSPQCAMKGGNYGFHTYMAHPGEPLPVHHAQLFSARWHADRRRNSKRAKRQVCARGFPGLHLDGVQDFRGESRQGFRGGYRVFNDGCGERVRAVDEGGPAGHASLGELAGGSLRRGLAPRRGEIRGRRCRTRR